MLYSKHSKNIGIVIEGFDGTGKSTLAEMLSKELNYGILKFDGIPKTIDEFTQRMRLSAKLLKEPLIQDRNPLVSEAVYGVLREDGPFIPFESAKYAWTHLNPFTIYCDITVHQKHEINTTENVTYFNKVNDSKQLLIDRYNQFFSKITFYWHSVEFHKFELNGILRRYRDWLGGKEFIQ